MEESSNKLTLKEFISKCHLYLTPPGLGVYTVNTAKDKKDKLHRLLYSKILNDSPSANDIELAWKKSLEQGLANTQCLLLGIPSDCGGGIQRGANWGPLFLRETLLQSKEELPFLDVGDVRVIPHLLDDKYLNTATIENCRKALYQNPKTDLPVSPLSIAYDFAKGIYELFPRKRIFGIGGDHSISYPLARAFFESKKSQKKKAALIHFDAHTDLLEERLGIDLCFGTWASQIIPFLEKPSHLVQIGIRSSAKTKDFWENKFGIKQVWAKELLGGVAGGPSLETVAKDIIKHLKSELIEEIYISFDIDCLDETYAGATGTPEPGGLGPFEAMSILQSLFEHFPITGADIVEIAPLVRPSHIKQMEPETTLMVAQSFAIFLTHAMSTNA